MLQLEARASHTIGKRFTKDLQSSVAGSSVSFHLTKLSSQCSPAFWRKYPDFLHKVRTTYDLFGHHLYANPAFPTLRAPEELSPVLKLFESSKFSIISEF